MLKAQQLSVSPTQTPVQAGQIAVSPYGTTAMTDIGELLTSIMPLVMLMMVMMMIMPMMKGMAEAFKAK